MDGLDKKARRFLPLTEATYCILAALAEACHGYGIMQRVEAASGGRVRLGPGTLYGALTKLLQQKLIVRSDEVDGAGERRKLYVLTPLGRVVVEMESRRLAEMVRVGRDLLRIKGGQDEK